MVLLPTRPIKKQIELCVPSTPPGESFSGFGDEHSGQFNANIQNLKPFYDTLINKLEIGPPNP